MWTIRWQKQKLRGVAWPLALRRRLTSLPYSGISLAEILEKILDNQLFGARAEGLGFAPQGLPPPLVPHAPSIHLTWTEATDIIQLLMFAGV